jgi:cell division protein FtsN
MSNRRSSPKKERRRYAIQLTLSSLLLLSIGLVFLLAWVFSLGIMVGRGFLPSTIGSFSSLKEKASQDVEEEAIHHLMPLKDEELTFYEKLVSKKERAKKRLPPDRFSKDQDTKKEVSHVPDNTLSYSVQVAALKDKGKTEKLVGRLTGLGYPAYYYQTLINDEIYYRIRCGPFPNLKEVRECAKRLADREGFEPFIIHPASSD